MLFFLGFLFFLIVLPLLYLNIQVFLHSACHDRHDREAERM